MKCPKCQTEGMPENPPYYLRCPVCRNRYSEIFKKIKQQKYETEQKEIIQKTLNFKQNHPFIFLLLQSLSWLFNTLIVITVLLVIFIYFPKSNQTSTITAHHQETVAKKTIKVVFNDDFDNGSVWQVVAFLKKYLKDPESYQSIEWSKVVEMQDGSFLVIHIYRAKNSFNGYNIANQAFSLDGTGKVISVLDIPEKTNK